MADQTKIDRISPLASIRANGNTNARNLSIVVQPAKACVLISAQSGKTAALSKLLKKHYAVTASKPGQSDHAGKTSIRWAGFEQWFLISDTKETQSFFDKAHKNLSGIASIVDQSHGRVTIVIKGKHASDVLAKGTAVDLHDSVFKTGACATTQIAQISVHLTKIAENHFEVSLYRSFTESFWHWVNLMAREFG